MSKPCYLAHRNPITGIRTRLWPRSHFGDADPSADNVSIARQRAGLKGDNPFSDTDIVIDHSVIHGQCNGSLCDS
jgi:hypothetical protein